MTHGTPLIMAVVASAALFLTSCALGRGDPNYDSNGIATAQGNKVSEDDVSHDEQLIRDAEIELLAFSQCMRDNGLNTFPDPTIDSDGNLSFSLEQLAQLDFNSPGFDTALDECDDIVDSLLQALPAEDQLAFYDAALDFAQCLRDEGIDVPDPQFEKGLQGTPFVNLDLGDPVVLDAVDKCQSVFAESQED